MAGEESAAAGGDPDNFRPFGNASGLRVRGEKGGKKTGGLKEGSQRGGEKVSGSKERQMPKSLIPSLCIIMGQRGQTTVGLRLGKKRTGE